MFYFIRRSTNLLGVFLYMKGNSKDARIILNTLLLVLLVFIILENATHYSIFYLIDALYLCRNV